MNKFNFPHFKLYTGAEIRAIRQTLRDSRSRFAKRFLLDFETIKAWENEENPRKPTGPANVIMQELERFAQEIKTEQRRVLESVRNRSKE
jgi:DNA-binding transcriptional regulator YiaG